MQLRTGDTVKIQTGKDKGKTGKIIQVFGALGRVVVDGVNQTSKHVRTRKQGEKGQKISFFAPIAAANVMLICPKCGKMTRIGHKAGAEGKKFRICVKCKETV